MISFILYMQLLGIFVSLILCTIKRFQFFDFDDDVKFQYLIYSFIHNIYSITRVQINLTVEFK